MENNHEGIKTSKITCIICMENFDKAFRKPMVLPCGHTFCLYCLSEMKTFGKQQCPSDRETFIFNDLKVNFILLDLIEQGLYLLSESIKVVNGNGNGNGNNCIVEKKNGKNGKEKKAEETNGKSFESIKKQTIEQETEYVLNELLQLMEVLDEAIQALTNFLKITKHADSYDFFQKSELKEILSTAVGILTTPFSKRSFLANLKINTLIQGIVSKTKRESLIFTLDELSWIKTAFLTYIGKAPKLTLLYRASRDGFSAYDFHSRCDHKGPNLVVCHSEHHLKFGGYNDFHWAADINGNNYKSNNNQAFLFSLSKRTVHRLNKGREQYATYQKHDVGPHFGVDLHISSYCNINMDSYSNLGCNYSPPKNYEYDSDVAKAWLAGEYQFRMLDYEVFQILMFFEIIFGLLQIILGIFYPVFQTFSLISNQNLQTSSKVEIKKWISFWMAMGICNIFVFPFLDFLPSSLSFLVSFLKLAIVAFLALPQLNGSDFFYSNCIEKGDQKIIGSLREVVKNLLEKIGSTNPISDEKFDMM